MLRTKRTFVGLQKAAAFIALGLLLSLPLEQSLAQSRPPNSKGDGGTKKPCDPTVNPTCSNGGLVQAPPPGHGIWCDGVAHCYITCPYDYDKKAQLDDCDALNSWWEGQGGH